jgi:membrane protein DedA with SNARE-associated domain
MNFTHLVATFSYWAVLAFVAIQCAGIAFPGGAVLVSTAIYAGTTHRLAVAPIILAAAVGSIFGNLLGFYWAPGEGIVSWPATASCCAWKSTS